MANIMEKTGLWGLLCKFEREIPTKDTFVDKRLKDTSKDKKDVEYIVVVTDIYNTQSLESTRVHLNEEATKILLEYVNSYSTLHKEFESKVTGVKAKQSYVGRSMKILLLLPTVMGQARKAHELKKQTYQRLVDTL